MKIKDKDYEILPINDFIFSMFSQSFKDKFSKILLEKSCVYKSFVKDKLYENDGVFLVRDESCIVARFSKRMLCVEKMRVATENNIQLKERVEVKMEYCDNLFSLAIKCPHCKCLGSPYLLTDTTSIDNDYSRQIVVKCRLCGAVNDIKKYL